MEHTQGSGFHPSSVLEEREREEGLRGDRREREREREKEERKVPDILFGSFMCF